MNELAYDRLNAKLSAGVLKRRVDFRSEFAKVWLEWFALPEAERLRILAEERRGAAQPEGEE